MKKIRAKRKKKNFPIVEEMIEVWETAQELDQTDVLGSYTGTPTNGEEPEQDADDL